MSYSVYILQSEISGKYYTGISENPQRRLEFHNTLEKGFTARYRPWKIVFTKEYQSREEATQAEKKIKNWKSRRMIELLIRGIISL